MIASAAVLAQVSAPLVAFLRVTASMKSMLNSASNAVLVQVYVLLALRTLQNNLSAKERVCIVQGVCPVRYTSFYRLKDSLRVDL